MSKLLEEVSDILGEYVEKDSLDRIFTQRDREGKITARVRNELIKLLIKHLDEKE